MKDSLKEYLTELRERATMDEKLSKEEREAEIAKLKAIHESAKFDPNAKEDDDHDEAAAKPNTEKKESAEKTADGKEDENTNNKNK